MPSNKTEALITIKKIGSKDNKFWIQDTKDEYYSGFKEYQGTPNNEYGQLTMGNHGEAFKEGDAALVVFVKSLGANDKIYKNLRGIYPADGAKAEQTENARPGANSDSTAPTKDRNWEREAYEKCCSIWAAAMLEKHEYDIVRAKIEGGAFHNLFQAIKQSGEKHFEPSKLREAVKRHAPNVAVPSARMPDPDLPTIQIDEELNPFVNDEPPIEAYDDSFKN